MTGTPNSTILPPTEEEVKAGTPVNIGDSIEKWSEFNLDDGSKVRIKTGIVSAVRLNRYDENGNPIYVFNMSPVVVIQANDALKQK